MNYITINSGIAVLDKEISGKLAEYEKTIKELKEKEEELKEAILDEMKKNNVIKIDTPEIAISFVDETFKETFDSKLFREQNPELYDAYIRMTKVKANIRIKVK